MKISTLILSIASILGLVFLPKLQASDLDKKTFVTLHQSMEIPGMVLPAGDYVIKRADQRLPDVVRFTDSEENRVYATVFAIPTYRAYPTNKVVIETEERRAGSPEAIKKWFYPGDIVGAEFVYPKSSTTLLASAAAAPPVLLPPPSATPSVTAPPAVSQPPVAAPSESLGQPDPQPQEEVEIAQATPPREPAAPQAQPTPPAASQPESQSQSGEQLPATASNLPLIGILGGLGIFGGMLLRRLSRNAA